jgi:hypothetical protein
VNRRLVEAIVGSLQLSGAPYDLGQLARFSTRDWERCLGWLDHSGLTLYLLQRLKDGGATELLPAQVLARFEQNLSDNKSRVRNVLAETRSINERFDSAGVQYVVVKGLSLWPEFCSDPCLRTQTDIDYLIARPSLSNARNVLEQAGYEARGSSHVQFEYELPLQRVPSQYDSPYKTQTTPTVELHLGIWEDVRHRVPLQEPAFILDNPRIKEWGGLNFPVLSEQDAFLLQVLHAFQHVLSYWVKLSWLLEIGRFIEKRREDSVFWSRFTQRLDGAPRLAEFATIALQLTAKTFSVPMPAVAQYTTRFLRPSACLWLEKYGARWAHGERPPHRAKMFPDSKLSLFFQTEYIPDIRTRRDFLRHELMPWKVPGKKPSVAFRQVKSKPWTRLQARWLDSAYTVQRLSFHAGAGLRYLWEWPRWRYLTKSCSDSSDTIRQAGTFTGGSFPNPEAPKFRPTSPAAIQKPRS